MQIDSFIFEILFLVPIIYPIFKLHYNPISSTLQEHQMLNPLPLKQFDDHVLPRVLQDSVIQKDFHTYPRSSYQETVEV